MQYAHISLRLIVHYKHLAIERKSNMKAFFYTFGCKVNQYETENIKEAMLSEGMRSLRIMLMQRSVL